jgi:uncharacterized protein
MQCDKVINILHQQHSHLREHYGVKSLALFGSVARNEVTSASDVDILVEFDRLVGLFGLFALQDYLEGLLGCPVDLGTPDSLKPRIRARVLQEMVHVEQGLGG